MTGLEFSIVNVDAFNAALREYMKETKRELAYVLNKKLFIILCEARKKTPIANMAQIEAAMGVTRQEYLVKSGKHAGTIAKRTLSHASTKVTKRLAKDIVQAARYRRGLAPLEKNSLREAIAKMIGARLRAVGSLRAGWRAAITKLSKATRESSGDVAGPRVKQGSQAWPATDGLDPVAKAQYNVTTRKAVGVDPRVVAALQTAFDNEARDMANHIGKVIQGVNDKFSGRP